MNAAEYGIMRSVEDGHWWYRGLRSMLRHSLPGGQLSTVPVILDASCGIGANLHLLRKLVPEGALLLTSGRISGVRVIQSPVKGNY